ncbi:MAG: SycD/LcrH family type III secretion system chaperone [Parachlamydiales bacterium]|jgi:type III secretion system low calcium response chaperone LcrH/SycD
MGQEKARTIEERVKELTPSEKDEMFKKMDVAFERVLKEKIPLFTALNIPHEVLDFTYDEAYRMYRNGHFEKAQQYFELLNLLDSKDKNFILGLAACLQMRKLYKNAADVYDVLANTIPTSPLPHFYKYECFMQMNQYDEAKASLEKVIELAGTSPEFIQMSDKAKMMLEGHVANFPVANAGAEEK